MEGFVHDILPWLIVAFCIFSEAFFAMSELSIVSANRIRLEELVREGNAGAKRVLWLRDHPDRLFGTTLLGTNLSTVTGSTVASLKLMELYPEHGQWWALLLMSPLVLIGGEIIPKSIGQSRAETLSIRLSGPLIFVYRCFSPVVMLVRGYTHFLYRIVGIDPTEGKAFVSREELVLLMEPDAETSEIEDDEREMISRVLEFNQLRARDSMVPLAEMVGISHEQTVADAVDLVRQVGFSRLPVFEQRIDNVVGILHHLDLFTAPSQDTVVSSLMRPAYFVPETQEVDELLFILQREAASAAIVVDEFGGTVGLLTLEDIIEEIVGEIHDEYDSRTGRWRKVNDGHNVDARAQIEELNQELGLCIPEDPNYETLAGYLLERFRYIPRVGESVELEDGRRLTIVRASARAIQEVHLASHPEAK